MKESSGVSRRTRAASCLAQRPATRGRSQPAKKAAPGLDDPLLLLQPQPQPQPQPRPSSRLFDSASLPRPAASASVVSIRFPSAPPRLRLFPPLPLPLWPRPRSPNALDLLRWPRAAADPSWASCLAPDAAPTPPSPRPATSRPQRHRGPPPRPAHHPPPPLLVRPAAPSLTSPAPATIPKP